MHALIVYPNYGADFTPYIELYETEEKAKEALHEEYEKDKKDHETEEGETYESQTGTFAVVTFRDLSEARYEVIGPNWIEAKEGSWKHRHNGVYCTSCGKQNLQNVKTPFCPHCGARMKGVEHETD